MQQRVQEPEWIFPFEGMDIGESFFIPTLRPAEIIFIVDTRAKVAKVRVKAFTSSKEGHLGVRVWRIG
jgi:hypothetical protein